MAIRKKGYLWKCPKCGGVYKLHKDVPVLCRKHSPPVVTYLLATSLC